MSSEVLTREIDFLKRKQVTLQKGLHIALIIERLNRGLDAAMVSRSPNGFLPANAIKFFQRLDEVSKALPLPLLELRVQSLGKGVRQDFEHILFITRITTADRHPRTTDSGPEDVDGFLQDFVAKSEKLVGMRVALHKKGIKSEGLKLDVPTQLLRRRLSEIGALESHCRKKIRLEVQQLRQDTYKLLEKPQLPPAMRDYLKAIFNDLQVIIKQIDSGGEIAELPVLVQTLQLDQEPVSSQDLSELLNGEVVEELPVEHITIEAPEAMIESAREPAIRDTLHIWLNTPLDVSWGNIRDWQVQKAKKPTAP